MGDIATDANSALGTPAARSMTNITKKLLGLIPDPAEDPSVKDAVFVCIDCEAWEREHTKTTELGIAILDTRDISGLNPGDDGKGWVEKVKPLHFRILEYSHLVNRRFVLGREDFFNFGTSTWIKLADAPKLLERLFADPTRVVDELADFGVEIRNETRATVVVGHGFANDKDFLRNLGFNMDCLGRVAWNIDTQTMAGGTKKRTVGLRKLLLSLGLDPVNLHNAGNDAFYTLQAMIVMAIKDDKSPGSVSAALAGLPRNLGPEKYTNRRASIGWAGTAGTPRNPSNAADMADRNRSPACKPSGAHEV